jgi:hypothetical protein
VSPEADDAHGHAAADHGAGEASGLPRSTM